MTYIPTKRREKAATVRVKGPDGKEKDKFPVDSAKTAKSAIKLLGHAVPPLTPSQKSAVIRKAAKFGVHPGGKSESKAKPKKAEGK